MVRPRQVIVGSMDAKVESSQKLNGHFFRHFFAPYLFHRSRNNRRDKLRSKFWREKMLRKPHLKLLRTNKSCLFPDNRCMKNVLILDPINYIQNLLVRFPVPWFGFINLGFRGSCKNTNSFREVVVKTPIVYIVIGFIYFRISWLNVIGQRSMVHSSFFYFSFISSLTFHLPGDSWE